MPRKNIRYEKREWYKTATRFFITITTFKRAKYFSDPATVSAVLERFYSAATKTGFNIKLACFMPDHLHALIVRVDGDTHLSDFVADFKQRTAYEFAKAKHRKLWQKKYYDRILRDNEPDLDVINYMLENPRAAGLVELSSDYPHFYSQTDDVKLLLGFDEVAGRDG